MVLFYREKRCGDYLAIETSTNRFYLDNFGKDHFEGRATAIAGLVGSVSTTGISREYLKAECKRVAKKKVPKRWLLAISY